MNARKEFELTVEKMDNVLCADVDQFCVREGFGEKEYQAFLKSLDFEYDNGFGGQELYGTIWMKDGTWYTRGEYDGSEWWQLHRRPEIPTHLKNYV